MDLDVRDRDQDGRRREGAFEVTDELNYNRRSVRRLWKTSTG